MVGPEHVLADPAALPWFGRDALSRYRGGGVLERLGRPPVAVVRPGDATQVALVVAWARRRGLAVVARGGGTGVMGGAVPTREAVVVDLGRMDRVEVDEEEMVAVAGAGAPLARVAQAAEAAGLLFPHDPWSLSMATVGGAISTDGMGYLYGRYGTMGELVVALEVVLADGTVWQTPRVPTGPCGPDLVRLFAGAQGTFGIITRAVLRLYPAPERRIFAAWRFSTFAAGFQGVQMLLRSGVAPALLDLSDSGPSRDVLDDQEQAPASPGPGTGRLPPRDAGGHHREISTLCLGFFGLEGEAQSQWQRACSVLAAAGGQELGSGPAEEYWRRRHALAERWRRLIWETRSLQALDEYSTGFEYLNVALPARQVLPFRERALEMARRTPGVVAGETGLWGRPEIFSLVLFEADGPAGGVRSPGRLLGLVDELLRLCQRMGGSMEAIHGAGLRWRHLLQGEWGAGLEVLHRIKRALDPHGVLNPGKWGEEPEEGP